MHPIAPPRTRPSTLRPPLAGSPPVSVLRRHDIDWLRILAVLLLFPFHTARIFNIGDEFYVKSARTSQALSVLVEYLDHWQMPLLFLLAGASSWYALSRRTGRRYADERTKRLLVPFLFGWAVIVPVQSYLGLRSHSGFTGSFWGWYPRFWQLQPDDIDGYFLGGLTWGHLWFIIHLFLYSLILLPLLLFLRRSAGRRVVDVLARAVRFRGVILLFGALTFLAFPVPDIAGGNPVWYMVYFLLGYLVVADERFGEAIDRHRLVALLFGPVLLVAVALGDVYGNPSLPGWLGLIIELFVGAFATWFSLVALLGYGRRFLSFSDRFLTYAAEASYPIYILHQTVIVAVGFFVVSWAVSVPVKYGVILLLSVALSAAIYEVVVRRVNVLRFFFGMKKLKPAAPVGAATPAAPTAVGPSQ